MGLLSPLLWSIVVDQSRVCPIYIYCPSCYHIVSDLIYQGLNIAAIWCRKRAQCRLKPHPDSVVKTGLIFRDDLLKYKLQYNHHHDKTQSSATIKENITNKQKLIGQIISGNSHNLNIVISIFSFAQTNQNENTNENIENNI